MFKATSIPTFRQLENAASIPWKEEILDPLEAIQEAPLSQAAKAFDPTFVHANSMSDLYALASNKARAASHIPFPILHKSPQEAARDFHTMKQLEARGKASGMNPILISDQPVDNIESAIAHEEAATLRLSQPDHPFLRADPLAGRNPMSIMAREQQVLSTNLVGRRVKEAQDRYKQAFQAAKDPDLAFVQRAHRAGMQSVADRLTDLNKTRAMMKSGESAMTSRSLLAKGSKVLKRML
jgi:hypothetical protein